MPVRDAARRKVDPIETSDPPALDDDLGRDHCLGRLVVEQLLDEPRPVLELVLDPVPRTVGRRGEREDHGSTGRRR